MAEDGDSKWGTAFFLGFLLGVFVCLGAGGTFVVTHQQRARAEAEMMRQAAEEAERRALMEADRALEMERRAQMVAEQARKEAAELKGAKKDGE